MPEITEGQIDAWKAQYGDVFKIIVDDKECYLHKPDRNTLAAVTSIKNPIKVAEFILNNCWIDGDEDIKTKDDYFLGVSQQLTNLIQVKAAEIVKL